MATVRVHNDKCPECRASIEIPPEVERVKCAYCGTALVIEKKKPPRDPTLTAPRTVYVPPRTSGTMTLVITLTTLLPFAIGARALWPMIRGFVPIIGNMLPAKCGVNGRVELDGKTWKGTGTLIEASTNCTIVIKDSHLEGDIIIDGDVNVDVELDHSTLIAHKRAVVGRTNMKVKLKNKSEVSGDKGGIELGTNGEVHLDDSVVRSPNIAIKSDSNLSIDGSGGEINGGVAAIKSSHNRRLELDGTKVVGPK